MAPLMEERRMSIQFLTDILQNAAILALSIAIILHVRSHLRGTR